MAISLPLQILLGSSALFSIFSYALGGYYIDVINGGSANIKPIAAFFIAMPLLTQIMWIVSLVLILTKTGLNFIITILSVLQFIFVFSIATFASTVQSQLNYSPDARRIPIVNDIYNWLIVVIVFSWAQSLIMGANVFYCLKKMDKPLSLVQAQLNSSK